MSEDYLALIPAAGIGSRAQLKLAKQFTEIGSKTIIEYAIDPFLLDENCKKSVSLLRKKMIFGIH